MKKKILFVCKFNNTRSQISAFLFNKLNKNKEWIADSAGVIGGRASPETLKNLSILKKNHKMKFTKKKTLTQNLLFSSDRIIIVAEDVPIELFSSQIKHGIKVVKWNVKDGWRYKDKSQIERLEKVYQDLEKRIKKFIKNEK
jgi:protein-tyrosine-phosphatase